MRSPAVRGRPGIRSPTSKGTTLIARLLERLAATLARELGLEEGNVFVLYDEARSGRLYTGGAVR